MQLTIKAASWAACGYVMYLCAGVIIDNSAAWDMKIKAQRENYYQVTTSRDKWRELAGFREQWPMYFKDEAVASSSRHELYNQLRLSSTGLTPLASRISTSHTEVVNFKGQSVGISRTCVFNEQSGFVVSAANISALQLGLQQLEQRREIAFTDMALINQDGAPRVVLKDLCIYFRIGDV
jgi:hypothetical protein